MRKITIELAEDTTATECVSCEYRESWVGRPDGTWDDRCNVFRVLLDKVSPRNFVKRAPECIAAEKDAGSAVENYTERRKARNEVCTSARHKTESGNNKRHTNWTPGWKEKTESRDGFWYVYRQLKGSARYGRNQHDKKEYLRADGTVSTRPCRFASAVEAKAAIHAAHENA